MGFHLGQLLSAVDRGRNASIPRMLTGMEYYLTGIACHTPLSADVVTSFMSMLRHGTPEIIRTITALADDNMPDDVKNVLEFKALWEAIDYDTKAGVGFHLQQLLNAIDRGRNASIPGVLEGMEYYLTRTACHPPLSAEVVTSFMDMLRWGTSEIIRTITALADDNMPEDTDEEMRGNDSDGTMINTASSPGSGSDDSMPDGSEKMSFGTVHSLTSGSSNEPMPEMRGG